MTQKGYVFAANQKWYLRYRDNFLVNGEIVRKQKCVFLANKCDRYRRPGDLDELVAAQLAGVRAADKCPQSSESFVDYVENTYLPFVSRSMKPSTYAGYRSYFLRYLKPRTESYALRDFTVAIVARLLKDIAGMHELNRDTVTKIRSILSGIFTYAISEGHYPARSAADNPASRARIPEAATEPRETVAASREQVQSALEALKALPLERAALAIAAYTGCRPGEMRGIRWEEWNRSSQHIAVNRAVWHTIVGSTKTEQSKRFVAVVDELREILLDLWKAQGSPISGYILAGAKGQPAILDNMSRRTIRPTLEKAGVTWHGFYSLRRFHATEVRMKSGSTETAAKALGNTKDVCDKHYVKRGETVLPDVRKAVNDAFSGLIQ